MLTAMSPCTRWDISLVFKLSLSFLAVCDSRSLLPLFLFSTAVRDRMVLPPPPPHHLYAKANTSSSIYLHWGRPAFTSAQIINYTLRCNPVGLQNASLVLYLQTCVSSVLIIILAPIPFRQFVVLLIGIFMEQLGLQSQSRAPRSAPGQVHFGACLYSVCLNLVKLGCSSSSSSATILG